MRNRKIRTAVGVLCVVNRVAFQMRLVSLRSVTSEESRNRQPSFPYGFSSPDQPVGNWRRI